MINTRYDAVLRRVGRLEAELCRCVYTVATGSVNSRVLRRVLANTLFGFRSPGTVTVAAGPAACLDLTRRGCVSFRGSQPLAVVASWFLVCVSCTSRVTPMEPDRAAAS